MALKLVASQISQQLAHWYAGAAGQKLLQETEATISPWFSDLVGYYAVELSYFESGRRWSGASRVRSHFLAAPSRVDGGRVVCDFAALPFDTESVDLVVAHHAFEFAEHPHALLREIQRVLIPGGRCVIIAFNPAGRYGVTKFFKSRLAVPWGGNFFSSMRVRDWLSVLDFEVDQMHYCAPPWFQLEGSQSRFGWLPVACRRYAPFSGALFAMSGIKRVLRPIVEDALPDYPPSLLKAKIAQPTT